MLDFGLVIFEPVALNKVTLFRIPIISFQKSPNFSVDRVKVLDKISICTALLVDLGIKFITSSTLLDYDLETKTIPVRIKILKTWITSAADTGRLKLY